jgi:hypothetical protein
MNRPSVSRELFLPLDRAWWDGSRFTLGRWRLRAARPALRGVRLQEPRPANQGPVPERDTQTDLLALIGSVAEMRQVPELAGLVLSEETLVGTQQGTVPGKRVLFGLSCRPGGRFESEEPAAAECHRVLSRAIKRAGFSIAHPREPFDPASGFSGLSQWAAAARLRRKGSRRILLLLLLLLPLLVLFVPIPGTGSIPVPGTRAPAAGSAAGVDQAALDKALSGGGDPYQDLKKLESLTSALSPSQVGSGSGDRTAKMGYVMLQVGTAIYFLSGAWLIWAAEAGILAVIGLLILPGYPLVLASSNWSKTWKPLLIHVVSIVMIIAGVYYIFLPYFRMVNSLLG